MNITKSVRRERRRFKRKHGMRVSGKSVLTLQRLLVKKGGGA